MPERARGVIPLRCGGCWRAGPRREKVSGGTEGLTSRCGRREVFLLHLPQAPGRAAGCSAGPWRCWRCSARAFLLRIHPLGAHPRLGHHASFPGGPGDAVQPSCPASQGGMGTWKGWGRVKGCRRTPAAPLNALIQWRGAYRHQEQGSGPCQMIPGETRRQTLVLETAL